MFSVVYWEEAREHDITCDEARSEHREALTQPRVLPGILAATTAWSVGGT